MTMQVQYKILDPRLGNEIELRLTAHAVPPDWICVLVLTRP